MGLFDFFKKKVSCPFCGNPGARQGSGGRVLCPNFSCPNFDAAAVKGGISRIPTKGNFAPQRPLTIRYRNFRGQDMTFTTEASTAYRKKNHIVVQAAPTGRKISLARERIQNLSEVERALPPKVGPGQEWPSARERQVLNYHKKYKTTSPLYEKIRAKYPNW